MRLLPCGFAYRLSMALEKELVLGVLSHTPNEAISEKMKPSDKLAHFSR
jgi:hypothetical protein